MQNVTDLKDLKIFSLFRYREWIASRIKIKEDKKRKKKKGRLSELQGKDGDETLDSDRSMAETETDVSMAAGELSSHMNFYYYIQFLSGIFNDEYAF
jgi:hypothetical protein